MKLRKKRKGIKDAWLEDRGRLRLRCTEIKLNFVAGILNRFFAVHLLSMRIRG